MVSRLSLLVLGMVVAIVEMLPGRSFIGEVTIALGFVIATGSFYALAGEFAKADNANNITGLRVFYLCLALYCGCIMAYSGLIWIIG